MNLNKIKLEITCPEIYSEYKSKIYPEFYTSIWKKNTLASKFVFVFF